MILEKPYCHHGKFNHASSFCFCVAHVLPYLQMDRYTYDEIMGYTAHAFHINIQVETVNKWGPTMYDWNSFIPAGLAHLGITSHTVSYSSYHSEVPDVQEEAIQLVRQSIQRGVPLIMWEALNPEFAIIYGYDDEKRLLYVIDAFSEGQIAYDKVGRGKDTPELFVLAMEKGPATDKPDLKSAIELILKYGITDSHDYWEFTSGLPAYDIWIDVFKQRKVDAYGNSWNIQVLRQARESAFRFLKGLAAETEDQNQKELFLSSSAAVQEAVILFNALEQMFPCPNGGSPNEEEESSKAIEILNSIKNYEKQALEDVQKIRDLLTT